MIEIKKSALNGAFGSAASSAKIVVPVYKPQDPLTILPGGSAISWPDIIAVSDAAITILRIRKDSAIKTPPFKRLDFKEFHALGLIKLKDFLNSCRAIYITPSNATYQDLAKLAVEYKLTGFLHKCFLEKLRA